MEDDGTGTWVSPVLNRQHTYQDPVMEALDAAEHMQNEMTEPAMSPAWPESPRVLQLAKTVGRPLHHQQRASAPLATLNNDLAVDTTHPTAVSVQAATLDAHFLDTQKSVGSKWEHYKCVSCPEAQETRRRGPVSASCGDAGQGTTTGTDMLFSQQKLERKLLSEVAGNWKWDLMRSSVHGGEPMVPSLARAGARGHLRAMKASASRNLGRLRIYYGLGMSSSCPANACSEGVTPATEYPTSDLALPTTAGPTGTPAVEVELAASNAAAHLLKPGNALSANAYGWQGADTDILACQVGLAQDAGASGTTVPDDSSRDWLHLEEWGNPMVSSSLDTPRLWTQQSPQRLSGPNQHGSQSPDSLHSSNGSMGAQAEDADLQTTGMPVDLVPGEHSRKCSLDVPNGSDTLINTSSINFSDQLASEARAKTADVDLPSRPAHQPDIVPVNRVGGELCEDGSTGTGPDVSKHEQRKHEQGPCGCSQPGLIATPLSMAHRIALTGRLAGTNDSQSSTSSTVRPTRHNLMQRLSAVYVHNSSVR